MSDTLERLRAALRETYAIDRQVGQGGMATVFVAEDLKHHRKVAIKVLRPELAANLGTERFLREIEMAARLQHPHIVPVYDSGAADGFLYYVMPFVEGESLRDLVKREGRIPIGRASEIIREAASGLAYAHAQGIVHRDIKPENIMLSAGHAVVADFGIARAVDASREADANLTGSGMAIGTPAYMSPEQATADRVDARSDQYALACVFYELVTGKQAFAGPSMQAMLTAMLTGPRPRLTAVVQNAPPEVDAATQRALATDPAARFPSVMAFADAVTQESSGAAAATRESRRWKRLAVVLPALVAVLAGVYVVFFAEPKSQIVSGAETIAVVPFTTSGAAAEGLGEGMVDLLAGNLDGVGPIRTIPARQVLREWQRRVKDGTLDLEGAIEVARRVKAASVLTGSIVATGGTARLTADLYDLQGAKLATTSVNGPTDSILTLADNLALGVLREIWRSREPLPSANTSGITSASMPAIRDYLRGEAHHRRGEWDSALVAFESAVTADSTFALAWYKLANTLGWIGNYNAGRAMLASSNAVKYSAALPQRVRRMLIAYERFQHGDPAAADSMRAYTAAYPEDADGWYLLGEAQMHTRGYRPLPPAELMAPFDRVLAIDSTLSPAAIHPMELALHERDTLRARRYLRIFESAGATGEVAKGRAGLAIIGGDTTDLARNMATVGGTGVGMAALAGRMLAPEATGTSAEALAAAFAQNLAGPMRQQGTVAVGLMQGGFGRQNAARAVADSLRAVNPELAQYVTMAPIYGGFADPARLERFATSLAAAPATNPFVLYLRALVAYDLGKTAQAQGFLRTAMAMPDSQVPEMIRGAIVALDGLRMVQAGDTARGLARADSGLRQPSGLANTSFTAPVALRMALVMAARPQTRDLGINRLRYGFTERLDFLAITQYYLGKAYEAKGDTASATAAYGQFVRLWDRADPEYAPRVTEAKAALSRLTGEGTR